MNDEARLRQARGVAIALALSPMPFFVVALLVPRPGAVDVLALPAGLAGVLSPVLAYRLYLAARGRAARAPAGEARGNAFVVATVLALAVSEGIALLGVVAYWLSGAAAALIGLATHAIVAGAVWPSRERLESFLEGRES